MPNEQPARRRTARTRTGDSVSVAALVAAVLPVASTVFAAVERDHVLLYVTAVMWVLWLAHRVAIAWIRGR